MRLYREYRIGPLRTRARLALGPASSSMACVITWCRTSL